jgi:hypothetical protein
MAMVKITHIGKVSDGPKPLTGPDHDKPIVVEIDGGRDFLELQPKAARKLADALYEALKARGV